MCVNMIRRLLHTNLKLGMHQNFESKNSLSGLAILYPSLLQWHKILSEKSLRKILNWIIPFSWKCQLKGNVLTFTDDKANARDMK